MRLTSFYKVVSLAVFAVILQSLPSLGGRLPLIDSDDSDIKPSEVIEGRIREIVREEMVTAIPTGFIYMEFPGQPSPQSLWPSSSWLDVTGTYAGHFFRASGGGAEEFGKPQPENSPRLSKVNSRLEKATVDSERNNVSMEPGKTSQRLWTGDDVSGLKDLISTSFTMTEGEVRPKNFAVRLWKKLN